MKPEPPIIIPAYNPSISVTAKSAYDFVHSDIINPLSYEDIIGYFGGKEGAVNYYKQSLASGYPRSAAFLMTKIIKGSLAVDGQDAAKKILLEDLSMLPEENLATSANIIISKITKHDKQKENFIFVGPLVNGRHGKSYVYSLRRIEK